MGFLDDLPRYSNKPENPGFHFNEETNRIEDWTYRDIDAEDPEPISISIEGMTEEGARQAFATWVNKNKS